MDEEGYPTEEELEKVRTWDYKDPRGWLAFIKDNWHLPDWGWSEEPYAETEPMSEEGTRYLISTAGWSGNESTIEAMQANHMLWMLTWVSSRRGGHFEFRVSNRTFPEKKP